jgi:hypothetical protein
MRYLKEIDCRRNKKKRKGSKYEYFVTIISERFNIA